MKARGVVPKEMMLVGTGSGGGSEQCAGMDVTQRCPAAGLVLENQLLNFRNFAIWLFKCWQCEIGQVGSYYTREIGKHYKTAFGFSLSESPLLNIYHRM